jgi:release factor glutamine methyltransferase
MTGADCAAFSAIVPAQAVTHDHKPLECGSPLARGQQKYSIAAARQELTQAFRQAGLDTPELDARLLVGAALGLDHGGLTAHADRALTPDETGALAAVAARRLAREPVARILGTKEFWSLPLKLNAHTLVPRPETETVIEAALMALDGDRTLPLRLLDLGTGSGALILSLLSELPAAFGIATDVSVEALDCAHDNAIALGLSRRTAFVACDYGAALKCPFDLVVSNPPYIARDDIAGLAPEVSMFDPRRALDGGPDGLNGYRAIAADARRLLTPNGALVVELGLGQADAVSALVRDGGLATAGPPRSDLSGVARALVLRPLP